MQKIYDLKTWIELPESQRLEFSSDRPRTVRFEVNAPKEAALYVAGDDGELRFLALVKGRDTIEFSADGAFSLMAEGDQLQAVWIKTADGDDVSVEHDAPDNFTKIVERRRRNPELELLVAKAMANQERRLAQQEAEIRALREASRNGGPVSGGQVPVSPELAPKVVSGTASPASGEADVGATSSAQAGELDGSGESGGTPSGSSADA